jgi:hypothetical protein
MRLARITGWGLRAFGLGYGTLGYAGPAHMTARAQSVTGIIKRDTFGHSSWFDVDNFHGTMIEIASR